MKANFIFLLIFIISGSCNNKKVIEDDKEIISTTKMFYHYINLYNSDTLDNARKLNMLDSALFVVNKLIDKNPTVSKYYYMKTNVLGSKKSYKELYHLLDSKDYPKSNNEIEYIYKALCLLKMGDTVLATQNIERADSILAVKISAYPDSLRLLINLVYIKSVKYDYSTAKKTLYTLLEKNPNSIELKGYLYNLEHFYDTTDVYFGP